MATTEYTGHVSAMRADSEFLGAEDLSGKGDVPIKIIRCLRSIDRKACGRTVKEMFSLQFEQDGKAATKEFWIHATNRKQILKLYGANVGEWKGKWLWLYVDEVKSPTGGMTLGIRIRDKTDQPPVAKPKGKAVETPEPTLVDKYAKRLNELKTRAEIEAAYLKFEQVAPTMDDAIAQQIYQLFANKTQPEGDTK